VSSHRKIAFASKELQFRTYVPADLGETFASGLPSSSPVQFAGRENDVMRDVVDSME
jgi:hypothetical protein